MIEANFDEAKQSQLTFVELLLAMGYKYLSVADILAQRRNDTSKFILKDVAFQKLTEINSYEYDGARCRFSDSDVWEAIEELENMQLEGLIDTSKKIYNMIMPTSGGKTIKVLKDGKASSYNFRFIDFEHPENNSYHVTVEFEACGKGNIRPDIVCFINGIPFVVIENKKSSVDVKDALSQINRNQGSEYCPKLFIYPQLLIGTNGKDIRYGTTGTPNKFFATWKEDEKYTKVKEFEAKVQNLIKTSVDVKIYSQICADLNGATVGYKQNISRKITEQDRGVVSLLESARLLDLAKNYIIYDAGVKKIMRYQQYYAINKILKRIEEMEKGIGRMKRKGGLLWHTQGSGKSLTMVMFVKALIEDPHIINPRILVVTDRIDLDKQISETFKNCGLKKKVTRTKTSRQLLDLIKEKNLDVITTLVHKFEKANSKEFVDDSENIFVLIDEAHRTQNGMASLEMNRIIPNACYIGFTGTPLMQKERESWKRFGGYIDKYTIDDALADKIILPLVYEGRYVSLISNDEQIDRHVDRVCDGLEDNYKVELQRHVKTQLINNNPQRIEEIAYDIEKHFIEQFQGTGLKAQIVAPSKFAAIVFQRYFEKSGKINTAVVISDENKAAEEDDDHKKDVQVYLKGVREKYQSLKSYEDGVIESFKKNPDGVEILIVVDKLLTGFDAPCNTVLYLAKDLRDHNLLQAIARVNRLYENKQLPKTAGYVIDYSENAKNLSTAMKLFGNYDEGDVKGALIDVKEKITKLEESYDGVHEIFKDIENKKDDELYLERLEDEQQRKLFYDSVNEFIRNFNECLALQDFVHEFKQIDVYKKQLKKFIELRGSANLRYADKLDLSEYKLALVRILDKYIDADKVELLTKQINIHDIESFNDAIDELGSDKSKAEAIAAQTDKTIQEKMNTDPEFYHRFSEKIKEILKKLHDGKIADLEALGQMKLIRDQVIEKKDEGMPSQISERAGSDIFYRNLRDVFVNHEVKENDFVGMVCSVYDILKKEAIVDWYKNMEVKRVMLNKIDDYLYDEVQQKMGIKLSNEDAQAVAKTVMLLAENNEEYFRS